MLGAAAFQTLANAGVLREDIQASIAERARAPSRPAPPCTYEPPFAPRHMRRKGMRTRSHIP